MDSELIGQNGGTTLQVEQDPGLRPSEDCLARHALLVNLRHELRNLLNAIIGFSEILLEDTEDAEGQCLAADLLYVNQTGKKILEVVTDVLDPAKIEHGLSQPDFQKIWGTLSDRLRLALSKLISRGEILLESTRQTQRQNLLDDMNIIYSSATKLKTVVERLALPAGAEDNGLGNLNVNPDGANGARATADAIGSLKSLSLQVEAQPSTILVVDDGESNRSLLCRWLNPEKHTIVAAENGRRAIDLLAVHDFDLVLLDVIMPEMNGYQVLKHIRSTERLHNIPVIMISAFDETDSAVRCIESGAEEYLTKPFDKNLLKARVSACLQKKIERDKTVRELSADLDNTASQLQTTEKELGVSHRKIGILEERTSRIQTAVRQEIEKTKHISILDILVMIGCGFILGLVFNAASPGALRLTPLSWSAEAPSVFGTDSAKAKFDTKSALFVDARPSEYFKRGHIPGAVNLPNTLFDFIYMMNFAGLDPETEIIVYGRDISRLYDEETAYRLKSRGCRNVSIMPDGLSAWEKSGYPLEK